MIEKVKPESTFSKAKGDYKAVITSNHEGRPPLSRGSQRTKDASYYIDNSYENHDEFVIET